MRLNPNSEGFLSQLYTHMQGFPTIWQVILQEAVRANHILFTNEDLAAIASQSDSTPLSEEDSEELADLSYQLILSNDLKSMRQLIANLPLSTKKIFFGVYERWIKELRQLSAACLN